MEMTDAKVVEKKIYEDGKKEYASKGLAGTALGIGIGGLALALLNGNGRGVFGSLGGGTLSIDLPDNIITTILFGSKKIINFTKDDFQELKSLVTAE